MNPLTIALLLIGGGIFLWGVAQLIKAFRP